MLNPDFKEIGTRLKETFRLSTRPLAVFGSEVLPPDTRPMTDINRCYAVAMFRMAAGTDVPAIYASADTSKGFCQGGLFHTGFIPVPDSIKYFVSTGKEDVRGGAAEYLKASPELVERCDRAAGPIHPPGKYLIVQACETLPPGTRVRSICCFGTGEQIRNMAALVHFDRDDPFSPVIVPWGSSCSTLITFPAGLAENAPRNTAFMGPQDPTQNHSLPPEMMALGIPADLAVRMADNLDASFVVRRPQVAFPGHVK